MVVANALFQGRNFFCWDSSGKSFMSRQMPFLKIWAGVRIEDELWEPDAGMPGRGGRALGVPKELWSLRARLSHSALVGYSLLRLCKY